MSSTLLINNGTIITLGKQNRVIPNGGLLIENGIIKKVGQSSDFTNSYDKSINARGKVVMPGFINAHMHFYSTFARGLGKAKPSKDFNEVLTNLWWRLDKALVLEDCYYSAMIMLLNAIRKGTTTFIDHHASPMAVTGSLQRIADAVTETGLRASLCYEVSDRDGRDVCHEGIKENIHWIRTCQQNKNEHLKAMFGLHAAFTLRDETLEETSEAAHKLDTGFHIHVAEAESDEQFSVQNSGMRVLERLEKFGILGTKTIAAHCVHIDEREMDIIAKTGTNVVHNPQSNQNNAVGIANVLGMMEKGIVVGLGTDAMTVNMFEEVRSALWAQHLKQDNPSAGFLGIVSTLFFNNAQIANRYWSTSLGELREGAVGDVILIDYYPPTPLSAETVLGHLIFGISQSSIDTTIVDGRILMENKELKINIDEEQIAARSRELADAMWKRF
jgi:putative selenium metabolism protein SsnA